MCLGCAFFFSGKALLASSQHVPGRRLAVLPKLPAAAQAVRSSKRSLLTAQQDACPAVWEKDRSSGQGGLVEAGWVCH